MAMAEAEQEQAMFEQVAETAKKLTVDEQRHLRGLLEGWLVASQQEWTPEQNGQLVQRLQEAGVVVHAPAEAPDLERFRAYRPVTAQGRPVSETLLEERR